MSASPPTQLLRGTLLASTFCALLACSPTPEAPAENEPAGWREWVATGAGVPVEPRHLESLAGSMHLELEDRLQQLATGINPGVDWRELFRRLQADHPTGPPEVLAAYQEQIQAARGFVSERDLVPLPNDEPMVLEARNPVLRRAFSLALYVDGRLGVIAASPDGDESPLRNHCRVCIPPLVVHETYPGHHVAFRLTGQTRLSGDPRDHFFHEGWALYSEWMMLEEGYYPQAEARLAAWRSLLLRVVRAQVDVQLHLGELDAEAAVGIYREQLQLPEDTARTEVEGHLRQPGSKASYLVGLLQILELRDCALAADPRLSLRDFHQHLLQRVASWPKIAREQFGVELGPLRRPELPDLEDQTGS